MGDRKASRQFKPRKTYPCQVSTSPVGVPETCRRLIQASPNYCALIKLRVMDSYSSCARKCDKYDFRRHANTPVRGGQYKIDIRIPILTHSLICFLPDTIGRTEYCAIKIPYSRDFCRVSWLGRTPLSDNVAGPPTFTFATHIFDVKRYFSNVTGAVSLPVSHFATDCFRAFSQGR